MKVRYFAYASNMDPTVMATRCPSHNVIGPACLPGYELAFTRRSQRSGTGVADIVSAPASAVWGVLYEIDERCLDSLDKKEGRGWAYDRVAVEVRLAGDGSPHQAQAYTVVAKEAEPVLPSSDYLGRLIAAAESAGLPEAYVATLRDFEHTAALH